MTTGETFGETIDAAQSEEEARRLQVLVEQLFTKLPAERIERVSTQQRLRLARDIYAFFSVRTHPVQVRVFPSDSSEQVNFTVIFTLMPDCPFIVDSIRDYLHQLDLPVRLLLHPILSVSRDPQGRVDSLELAHSSERKESLIYAEMAIALSPERCEELAEELKARLTEVLQATDDFAPMTARALAICDELAPIRELVEVRELLRWLVQGGFVFLGYRRYAIGRLDGLPALAVDRGSGLGILRDDARSRYIKPIALGDLSATQHKLLFEGPSLIIRKSRSHSRVHRLRPMDDVHIRRSGEDGHAASFDRFVGLFTSKAYAEEAQHVPVLRAKFRAVLDAEHLLPGSHDYKELVATFNSFPKEELFRAPVEELRQQLDIILASTAQDSIRLSIISDVTRGCVIPLVVMPRKLFAYEVRVRIQEVIERCLHGPLVYFHVALKDEYTTLLHFCFSAAAPAQQTVDELREEIARIARGWEDRLRDELIGRHGEALGIALCSKWCAAFDAQYRTSGSAERAADDIGWLEAMLKGEPLSVEVHTGTNCPTSELRLYKLGPAPTLSDLMPMMQNFGVRVLSEDLHNLAFQVDGQNRQASIQAFQVQDANQQALDKLPGASLLAEALNAVRDGYAEDDPLNALTLGAALTWREVALLRAYLAAAFQMKLAPARPALRRVLLAHPGLARILVGFFKALFDPAHDNADHLVAELKAAYFDSLNAVETIADDRVARTLWTMIEATVRTNFFCSVPSPDPYIALKFDSGRIVDLPDSHPLCEVHVNSPRIEGCHLRAGKVARGGIRYSDRPDDYRTEILGLMKTQTVKNSIIVPVGSKGGFVVKSRSGRTVNERDVVESYRTLIEAMLDLTDNLADGRIGHPLNVKTRDGDDPYLVVAADKGTASFSDIANEISLRRGFWLGDAFASGGRHGYDHKKLGITARGAWESARHHLCEMGRSIERSAPITMVGIGDMSGDVFGNGLLQSANVKLIAAFDHRHIFIDPDPDPVRSYAERKRLFELPHSQWQDYDRSALSEGGRIYRRGQKRIVLSEQARAALKCEGVEFDSDSLVRAILRADIDLLYNGGIGTYVRAGSESDTQVGDPANDANRAVASGLRAKIVVEGGNLGFTQRARIEYALQGGRINTDATDNSAGVDMSDHEVNLKILLQSALTRGAITMEARNQALEEAAEEVASLVLQDNRDQVRLLSLEQVRSRSRMTEFGDLVAELERRGWLRREDEALPANDAPRGWRGDYQGLTRPELAVISAYTKIDLAHRLEATALIDDPYLEDRFLRPYFPESIAGKFASEIAGHSLRRELIATELVNELVDLMGSTYIFTMAHDHGVEFDQVIKAWTIAAGLIGLDRRVSDLRRECEAMPVEAELAGLFSLERAVSRISSWALNCGSETINSAIGRFRPGLTDLAAWFEGCLAAAEQDRFEHIYRDLRKAGHREGSAHELARLAFSDHLLEVLDISDGLAAEPRAIACIYFELAHWLDFPFLESVIETALSEERWQRRAAQELRRELRQVRIKLTHTAVAESAGRDLAGALERLFASWRRQYAQIQEVLASLRSLQAVNLSAIYVAVRQLGRLTGQQQVCRAN